MENIVKAFYHDGYQLGMKATKSGITAEGTFDALQEMYAAIDNLNDSLLDLARQQGQPIHCKKGCSWCCHQPIFALEYELDYLKAYILNNFSGQEQDAISKRAAAKNDKLKNLKDDALLNSKSPCPLLKDGTCTTYTVRPMACRIYLSTNVDSCLRFYNHPEDKSSYPALLDFPMRAGRMMNEGFKAALKSAGAKVEEFRIEEKLC
ncbi:YkgJ family cysteine cluster protein [Maribellus mangrovi]|uniref:YkgJ family cysteine cluster protein n=1 Tax=Maribellus mangrovi TaxID=3133146 RepID=UPI0030EF2932